MLKFKLKNQFPEIIVRTSVIKVVAISSLYFICSIGHEEQIINSYSFQKIDQSGQINCLSLFSVLVYFMLCALM